MGERQIVALGGWPEGDEEATAALQDYVLGLARGARVAFVPTARGDNPTATVAFYEQWRRCGELTHVPFFPWPPRDLRERVLDRDVLLVGGGNTANMLAIWRTHGFDRILREAWESGVLLCGASAGMICWFEAGVTDSFGPQIAELRDGLGFLPGSACPHYDGEEQRRPVYRALVQEGFPPGLAADDGVALHFVGSELAEAVACRDGAQAYRVDASGETPVAARRLPRAAPGTATP